LAENTAIEWATHTFNPWVGCEKVSGSRACDNCYAEAWAKGAGRPNLWQGDRARTKFATWDKVRKWEQAARAAGERHRVFCASLADVFDDQVPTRWRDDLWHLIDRSRGLDWLLLTKRPENIARMLPTPAIGAPAWGEGWPHVWLGTTAEDQLHLAQRAWQLAQVPTAVRFLSCEPLLSGLNFQATNRWGTKWNVLTGRILHAVSGPASVGPIHWVIAGGESGRGARPSHPIWFRSVRDQCLADGAKFFFKQWGDWAPHQPRAGGDLGGDVRSGRVRIVHPTGQSDVEVSVATGGRNTIAGSRYMARVGKKVAGRSLDGREWNDAPCSPAGAA
jgi:protein gp37